MHDNFSHHHSKYVQLISFHMKDLATILLALDDDAYKEKKKVNLIKRKTLNNYKSVNLIYNVDFF